MATAVKRKLSGSTDGKPIKVVETATPGTAVHDAVAGTTPGTFDEVWVWAQNNGTVAAVLTVQFGSASADDNIIVTVPAKSGLIPIIPGLPLQNAAAVKAFASVPSVVSLVGFVNAVTD